MVDTCFGILHCSVISCYFSFVV